MIDQYIPPIVEILLGVDELSEITITEPMKSYKGIKKEERRRILGVLNEIKVTTRLDFTERLQSIMQVQSAIPFAAQILEVVPVNDHMAVALIEHIDGTLLWELESNRPSLLTVQQHLQDFVAELNQVNLVHADIRPWNIFYQATTGSFRSIDWGYAFFIGGSKYSGTPEHLATRGHADSNEAEIDSKDVERTIHVLGNPSQVDAVWHNPPGSHVWHPVPWE